ncbi:MAG: hypothetical protein ACI9W1_001335 [Candidatus Azotimanducaceae bacterium]|jgi:hypothetical protein
MHRNIVFSMMLLVLGFGSSQALATKVDLVCPCELRSDSQTSMIISAGALNREATTSGELRLRIAAHTLPSFFDGSSFTLGTHHLGTGLNAGASIANAEFKTGISVPADNNYFISLILEEKSGGAWSRVDFIRMRDAVTLSQAGGYSIGNSIDDRDAQIFFDGTPTISVSGSTVNINLPPLVNNGVSTITGNLELSILQADGPSIFESNFFTAATQNLGLQLGPKSQTTQSQITTSFSEESNAGFDYFHLRIKDGSDSLVFQTVRFDAGAIAIRSFSTSSVEILDDTDGDGVSNFNERLVGTSVTDPNSKPAGSTIDAIFYYTPGAPASSPNGDITARLDQILTVTNQIFSTSGTNVTIRNVLTKAISLSDTTSLSSILDMMEAQQGDFSDIRSLKTSTGADIAVVFLPFTSGDLCGLATLTGAGFEGDFAFSGHANSANATVYIDCRDNVAAHEIGHVLGVTHSRVEMARESDLNGGTFVWSTGHGVNNSFVTVMANNDDFGGQQNAPELNVFSSPNLTSCNGLSCGVAITDAVNGADAVKSIDTVRFQVAAFTATVGAGTDTDGDGTPDSTDSDDDNDGVPDVSDSFPTNSAEFADTDGDGTGNNADTDDDGDGVLDTADAFPLDSSETTDTDGDGVGDNSDSAVPMRLAAGQVIELSVTDRALSSPSGGNLIVPSNAVAVAVNVTVVKPVGGGHITVWPCGVPMPSTSNVNYVAGQVVANGVIAPVGSNGKVCFAAFRDTDLIVDIAGWFAGEGFIGATPKRLVDSRSGTGTSSIARISPDSPLRVKVTDVVLETALGASTQVPSSIVAAALNITAVKPVGSGHITVYPCDVAQPEASNLNYVAGQVVANGVIAPVSADGEVCIFVFRETDVIVDLAGWFTSGFTGSTPKRLVDTRIGTGGRTGDLLPAEVISVPVRGVSLSVGGSSQTVPSTATAAALNITVVRPTGNGHVTVWPCGVDMPNASNLNYLAGDIVANNVIAPIGDDGTVCLSSFAGSDVIVDISGWFENSSSNGLVGSTPKRLVDTRFATGPAPQ